MTARSIFELILAPVAVGAIVATATVAGRKLQSWARSRRHGLNTFELQLGGRRAQSRWFRYSFDGLGRVGAAADSGGVARDVWVLRMRATRATGTHDPPPGEPLLLVDDREYPAEAISRWEGPIPPGETRRGTFRYLLPPGVEPTRIELRERDNISVAIDV